MSTDTGKLVSGANTDALPTRRLTGLSKWAWRMQFVWAAASACALSLHFQSMQIAHPAFGGKGASAASFAAAFLLSFTFAFLMAWLIFGSIRFFADFFARTPAKDEACIEEKAGEGCNSAEV